MTSRTQKTALALALSLMIATYARAQDAPPANPTRLPEELEPRIVGRAGTTLVGFSGFVYRGFSSETLMPLNYIAAADVTRFITGHLAVRGGVSGAGSHGGESTDALPTGQGALALHAYGGGSWFLTPLSLASIYLGADYSQQLTARGDARVGYAVGHVGVQAGVSSRAALFVEGGYGVGLQRGSNGELLTRMVGRIGVRVRF